MRKFNQVNFVFIILIVFIFGWLFFYNPGLPTSLIPRIKPTPIKQDEINFNNKERIYHQSQQGNGTIAPVRENYFGSGFNNQMTILVDTNKLYQLVGNLSFGTIDDQIDAIILLSKIGTLEQKKIIENYAINSNQKIPIRIAAAENIDWEQSTPTVVNLLSANDTISEAMIYMASTKDLSIQTRNIIDEAIYSAFFQWPKISTQIAILNYFLEQNHSQFDYLITKIALNEYSTDQKEQVIDLIKQRKENS